MVKYANRKISNLCISNLRLKTSFKKKAIILLRKSRRNDISKAPNLLIRSLTRLLNYNLGFYVAKIVFLFRITTTTQTDFLIGSPNFGKTTVPAISMLHGNTDTLPITRNLLRKSDF